MRVVEIEKIEKSLHFYAGGLPNEIYDNLWVLCAEVRAGIQDIRRLRIDKAWCHIGDCWRDRTDNQGRALARDTSGYPVYHLMPESCSDCRALAEEGWAP